MFWRLSYYRSIGNFAAAASLLAIVLAVVGCTGYAAHSSSSPSQPVISLSTTSFNFNTVAIGQTSTQTLHVTNTGGAPLTLNSVTLQSSQFSLTGPSVPRTILPAQNVDYAISFVPTTAGSATASVQITSNATMSSASVSLAGLAEKAFAAVQVTPPSISFGNLNLQSTATQTVTLKNTGDINITISGITVAGAGFGYSSLSPGYSLTPNQSVPFQIWFRPKTSGSASGKVSILISNLSTPPSISVSGIGVTSTSPSPTPTPVQHSVSMSWGPSSSPVVGYRVYRDGGAGLSPLSAITPALTYKDSTVVSGNTYHYAVTSIDSAGGESPYSNEVTTVIPIP